MSVINSDRGCTEVLVRKIASRAKTFFPVKESHVREAVASAFGFRTNAALESAQKRDSKSSQLPPFNSARFSERLCMMVDKECTAYAIAALAEGTSLDIKIEKHSPARFSRYTHTQYSVTATLSDSSGDPLSEALEFHLPQFFSNGIEPYRVDSWWLHRVDLGEYAATRSRSGRGLLTAKFIDGVWRGELFVYLSTHQQDDANCIRSVRAALARAILPATASGVRCDIWRPDRYDYGAWRVKLTLGPILNSFIEGTELHFIVPEVRQRRVHYAPGYGAIRTNGKFLNGVWLADLYTNGIGEDENPSTLAVVRRELLKAVYDSLVLAGWDFGHVSRHLFGDAA